VLFIGGIQALSDFRRAKLLKSLQALNPNIKSVDAEYLHVVDTQDLSSEETGRLKQLVTYGTPLASKPSGSLYLALPRPGTISPWSSKATDIARNSGLDKVNRIERGTAYYLEGIESGQEDVAALLHDRMTETVIYDQKDAEQLFKKEQPRKLTHVDILKNGAGGLEEANESMGLALDPDEINYLLKTFKDLNRNPSDVELMMFAQINSEHARHKLFNANWVIDGQNQPKSLFNMIKNTHEKNNKGVLSAYTDNAAILEGPTGGRFFPGSDGVFSDHQEPIHLVIKAETHNHPTAISPSPGAATGIGGEVRDEAATGIGAKTKMGLSGYSVSNLNIKGSIRPWEKPYGKPERIASALDIMLEAPIGGASFANEFGRPNLAGYFRTFEQTYRDQVWGYHKPIMIAGGLGNIRQPHIKKHELPDDSLIIVLGGPAMLIGLGGGAASSMQAGASQESLDFASVQRGNGEMERRTQEVIDRCWGLGETNPILSIHDVGAGGLCNAVPELVHGAGKGANIELRDIPNAEPGLSPLEIWCNEAQERYVLAINSKDLAGFKDICERERCPFAVIGKVTSDKNLVLSDSLFKDRPINLPTAVLFDNPAKQTRTVEAKSQAISKLDFTGIDLSDAIERVLKLPAVGSKQFLITIGDRTVGGLVARDQMVGPWQVPASDVAVSASSFDSNTGEAMAMGERTPLALLNAEAAARIAIGEAITNLAAADIKDIEDIKLSANWMAAAGHDSEDQYLYDSVKTVGEEFCPELGICIPVGKDSLSMRTLWQENSQSKSVISPVSLIVSGFSPVQDVTKTLTPELDKDASSPLVLIDLSSTSALGGSALAQVYNRMGGETPDVNAPDLKQFFSSIVKLKRSGKILAYHDRSDGGLLTTLVEMAFASRSGLDIDLSKLTGDPLSKLFSEGLGAVIQVKEADLASVIELFGDKAKVVAKVRSDQQIIILDEQELYSSTRANLQKMWSETSYLIQKLRDNPASSDQEYATIEDDEDPGLSPVTTVDISTGSYKSKPKVAIFREQGVNGEVEMAAAFTKAGFTAVDVHLNDIISGRHNLDDFKGIAACGGFSYGDVLGAGEGWAKSILYSDDLRKLFSKFFTREDTFTLGVCNGCQVFASLKDLIPGAENWPTFLKNTSEQFEARLVMAQINDTPSIFLKGMAGSRLPVPTAHGEGRAAFTSSEDLKAVKSKGLVSMQYVDNLGKVTETYPANPNGSPEGITGLTTPDGRATIIMPHPERVFLSKQLSWHPKDWGEESPWFNLFVNARKWVG
jgi:phosphoribosylformylglycinamidine synthase